MAKADVFQPAVLSLEENRFVLDHLGESPVVACDDIDLPPGVNVLAVRPFLEKIYNYEQQRVHRSREWAGLDLVRDSITRFLLWMDTSAKIQKHGGPRHASQFVVDGSGRMYKYGIGADSAAMVVSGLNKDGSRQPFGVILNKIDDPTALTLADIAPWLGGSDPKTRALDCVNQLSPKDPKKQGTLQCSICGATEQFNQQKMPNSWNAARARMIRHLKGADFEPDRHLVLRSRYEAGDQFKVVDQLPKVN